MSAIRSVASAVVARPLAEVWEFVIDPANEKLWHTDVVDGQVLADQPLAVGSRVRWMMNFGGPKPVTLRIARFVPRRVQELRAENAVMGVRPNLVYEVEEDGDRTRFTRTIEMNPAGLARLMGPVMRRNVASSNEKFVGNLKRVLESPA